MQVHIDVVSDLVCPWCFIGKRRLEQALAQVRDVAVSVRWRPFQLNPQLPASGVDRARYVNEKFGARAGEIYARVSEVGRSVGIPFAFDRIARQPNTLASHQLIRAASVAGSEDSMVEALFRGYFLEGADLTSRSVLLELAVGAGLAASDAQLALDDEELRRQLLDEEQTARALGVEGVPFFVVGGRVGVSGAQEPAVLLRAIEQAVAAAPAPVA